MVSIRRRRLLGLCSGQNSFLNALPKLPENGHASATHTEDTKQASVHSMLSTETDHSKEVPMDLGEVITKEVGHAPPHTLASSFPYDQHTQQFPEVKRRKRHRRKQVDNQEPCIMRGVYFKNMKWQAAIKVDKKQIHLGTVGSQEEAARLYDRAAFMCGREPNFELSEEEKQELRKFKWDEFLAMTRSAITNKKSQRRSGAGSRPKTKNTDWEFEQGRNGFSASEDDNIVS